MKPEIPPLQDSLGGISLEKLFVVSLGLSLGRLRVDWLRLKQAVLLVLYLGRACVPLLLSGSYGWIAPCGLVCHLLELSTT